MFGEAVYPVPLVGLMTLESTLFVMTPVPPVNTAVRVDPFPITMVEGLAVKLVMDGGGTTLTVTEAVAVAGVVAEFVTVSV